MARALRRLDVLGFSEPDLRKLRKYITEPYGMVVVTGPTGSGKTTTLYAALTGQFGTVEHVEEKRWIVPVIREVDKKNTRASSNSHAPSSPPSRFA